VEFHLLTDHSQESIPRESLLDENLALAYLGFIDTPALGKAIP